MKVLQRLERQLKYEFELQLKKIQVEKHLELQLNALELIEQIKGKLEEQTAEQDKVQRLLKQRKKETGFQQTGLNLFGPFASKTAGQYNRRYGVILTCLTSRAVHLEMFPDLPADAFINTLRRFVSRRGTPQQIISDHGRNFTATEKELSKNFRAKKTMYFEHHYKDHEDIEPLNPNPFLLGRTHASFPLLLELPADEDRRRHGRKTSRN